ncbi:uncharacterized protein LOC131853148 [Achroia grisella]|uniref:uncharacterized protein LOC131853148 n=1 Tax=Achroia grisella TaxID=688607 RepID=UPI0027D2CD1A|nr:uncharacterized protein LOC131853148 [Achroia grisella]
MFLILMTSPLGVISDIRDNVARGTFSLTPTTPQRQLQLLCKLSDIVALQETWLLPSDLLYLSSIDDEFTSTGTSAVDTTAGMLRGRPHGGVAILWRHSVFPHVVIVPCDNPRISAIKLLLSERSVLVISLYMPICDEQEWTCIDVDMLKNVSNCFTFVSEAHGSQRWLDHCVVSKAAVASMCCLCITGPAGRPLGGGKKLHPAQEEGVEAASHSGIRPEQRTTGGDGHQLPS